MKLGAETYSERNYVLCMKYSTTTKKWRARNFKVMSNRSDADKIYTREKRSFTSYKENDDEEEEEHIYNFKQPKFYSTRIRLKIYCNMKVGCLRFTRNLKILPINAVVGQNISPSKICLKI
jgi:hypothetical protein